MTTFKPWKEHVSLEGRLLSAHRETSAGDGLLSVWIQNDTGVTNVRWWIEVGRRHDRGAEPAGADERGTFERIRRMVEERACALGAVLE